MTLDRIATVRSCYGEKFAVPRQPGLAPSAWGRLVFEPAYRSVDAVRGLDGFSHLWLVFGFHLTADKGWSPTVRPPRLGGNERVGVFASRSTFRPNGLGLSLVRLESIDHEGADVPVLHLGGVDLVDGTPVYDVKPHLGYAETPEPVRGGYAEDMPERLEVGGLEYLDGMSARERRVVIESLALDPRPATARDGREFGATICGRNVRFRVEDGICRVIGVA